MILCNICKQDQKETVLKHFGVQDVCLGTREAETLKLSLHVIDAEGEYTEVQESNAFKAEFKGDWCEGCLRKKLIALLVP
ncbi:hypothetical protein LCGC14_2317180 [marine sediment metagenome]|uniref:Uncharacterized protein n=1 Tax=marine sediment metagenome TaxID=412755 RepID=A0A0F9D6H0_9ZZZZ